MRGKAAFLAAIFILGSILPLIPPVYATGPTLTASSNGVCTITTNPQTCSFTYNQSPTAAQLLIMGMIASMNNVVTFVVSDSQGNSWTTNALIQCTNNICGDISFTQLSSSNAVTVYVKVTGSNSGSLNVEFEEWNGIAAPYTSAYGAGSCSAACSNALHTSSTPFSFGTTYVAYSFAYSSATGPWTAGSTFTTDNGGTTYCANGSTFCAQNSITVTTPTTFPITSGAGPAAWLDLGIVIGPLVLYTTTSCTFFQLQCWWFPVLFMALYSGLLIMVSGWMNVGSKGRAHVFLSSLTFGSLVLVILGVMNIVFPLIMLIINTAIVLRLRG